MPHQLRRGAGLLWNNAGCHWRLLLRGLPGPEAGERGAADGRQAVGERGSESAAADQHAPEDVAGLRESAHVDERPGVLLCYGFLHRRLRDGQRGGDGAVWPPAGQSGNSALRRALQDRLLLPGYRLRDDLYGGVPTSTLRRPRSLQVRALGDEHY